MRQAGALLPGYNKNLLIPSSKLDVGDFASMSVIRSSWRYIRTAYCVVLLSTTILCLLYIHRKHRR